MHHPVEGAEQGGGAESVCLAGPSGSVGKGAEQKEGGGVTGLVDNSGEGCDLARPGSWH